MAPTNIGASWRKPASKSASYAGPAGPREAVEGRPGVEVHHTVTAEAKTPEELRNILRSIWRDHVLKRGWSDIFYCYLIGSDGSIAEGRGPNRGTSSKVEPVTICLVGDFSKRRPPKAMLDAFDGLRAMLMPNVGQGVTFHRDRDETACPGDAAVAAILERVGQHDDDDQGAEPAPIAMPTLREGDRGSAVRRLQSLLHGEGYGVVVGRLDGVYGAKTADGVRRFQKREGIGVDGITGPATWGRLLDVPVRAA